MNISHRIKLIFDESKSLLKPLCAIAVLIGGGLVPFIQLFGKHLQSSQAIAIALLSFVVIVLTMLCWRLALAIENRNWFDKEYILLKNKWKYTLNQDGETLDGECFSDRRMICLEAGMSHLAITISKDECFVPFDPALDYSPEMLSYDRKNGTVSISLPHKKEGASFAFRINFVPSLAKDEEVGIKYKYKIPRFKMATLEYLRAKMATSRLPARDYEYNSIKVNNPIRHLIYEVTLPKTCLVLPDGLAVARGTAPFDEEEKSIVNKGWFLVENNDLGCRMILDRKNPPIKTGYRIKWRPPERDVLRGNKMR
jgi:hypothetical protein